MNCFKHSWLVLGKSTVSFINVFLSAHKIEILLSSIEMNAPLEAIRFFAHVA